MLKRSVTVLAPAKLNLSLDVVGTLPNGYHDLDMVMQTIDLYEKITLRRSNTLSLTLPGSFVPVNDKNTAVKAALAFFDYTGLLAGVDMTIYKRVPVRAGMAGGSADAAGVLVGLNSLLEQGGSITLPTGEVIHRHPDAVVVVTTNVSYEGCRGVNQSVLDRMNLTQDIELPAPEIMAQRAMSITGCEDDVLVGRMVQVVTDMADYCRKNGISDGNCGMRSLIDWIMSTEITGDPYSSALYTIVSKATSDEEDRDALKATVLEPIFAPKRKKAV